MSRKTVRTYYRRVLEWGNRRASCVSATAEDQPPSSGAWSGSSRTNCFQYSWECKSDQFLRLLGVSREDAARARAHWRIEMLCFVESSLHSEQV